MADIYDEVEVAADGMEIPLTLGIARRLKIVDGDAADCKKRIHGLENRVDAIHLILGAMVVLHIIVAYLAVTGRGP